MLARSRPLLAPLALMLLALAVRVYRIGEYTMFQGDQGIDALAARRLVFEGILPLEGPPTSAGGVHLGPFYYYLLAAPMALFGPDPLVQAIGMAVLGALSVGLLYWLAASWFGPLRALPVAALYALSPAVIVASRSAWNPFPAPFFLLLALVGLMRGGPWLLLTGAALGCLIQLHYFTAGVVLVCFAFAALRNVRWTVGGLALAGVLLAPFLIHELSSGLANVAAARGLAESTALVSDSVPRRLYAVAVLELVGRFLALSNEPLAIAVSLVLVGAAVLALAAGRRAGAPGGLVLVAALGIVLIQAALYRGPIFAHYLVPVAPLAFLLLAALPTRVLVVVSVPLLALSVWFAPWRDPPLAHLERTEAAAAVIAGLHNDAPFALWLLATDDSDAAYRYQLERLGLVAVGRDAPPPEQLFVICQQPPCADPRPQLAPEWADSSVSWQGTLAGGVVLTQLLRNAAD